MRVAIGMLSYAYVVLPYLEDQTTAYGDSISAYHEVLPTEHVVGV